MSADEKFFAWLDGELDESEAAEMGARVRADPKLARLAGEHRAMRERLRGAFDPLLEEPVPAALSATARNQTDVVRLEPALTQRRPGGGPATWMSLAATLAAGVLIGTIIPRGRDAPVQLRGDAIYAAATLADALDTQLASAPGNQAVRIGVTFRNHSGAICRSFTQPGSSGVACRSDNAWKIHGLYGAPEGQSADYRMAAGTNPQLAGTIASMMAGEPLDAAGEKAARDRGWQ